MGIQLDGINNEIKSQTKIDFPGSVGVAGTLTYEDVTNVDSIGIVTARTGVIVGSGVTLNATGVIATGIITATSFSGSGANLTGITGTTINNNADNRIITGSGTANTLEGEANLTWNGSALSATGSDAQIKLYDNSGGTNSAFRLMAYNGVNYIQSGLAFSSGSAADLVFSNMFGQTNLMRLTSGGQFNLGSSNAVNSQTTYKAQFETGTNKKISFYSVSHDDLSNEGSGIAFSRVSDGSDLLSGIFSHSNGGLALASREDFVILTGGGSGIQQTDERLRITSSGNIEVATTTTTSPAYLRFNSNRSNADDGLGGAYGVWNGNSVAGINFKTGADTTNKDDGRIQFVTYTGGSPYERMMILENGAVTLPDSTQGLRFGSAASQDFAIFHSGSNSHIDHFGPGNLYQDFANDFYMRFYQSAGVVRTCLTIDNGGSGNPEFQLRSNPTTAATNSGTHSPTVRFRGAGWNTNSGSVEVGTQLQSEHHYWSGSYSNTFGQTYPDFKIKMKNSDNGSYVEKFAFSGNGVMRLQSGGGINFHNYGGGSGVTSNTLDDFEEGTFTCTLSGSSGGSITAARACYTKIGNMVMCEATFVNPGNNSVSGNWTMSLPFQFIGGGSGSYGGGKVTYTRYVPALTGGFQSYTIFTYYGQGVAYLYKLGTNGSSESQWMGGSVNNSLLFSFTMTYTTNS